MASFLQYASMLLTVHEPVGVLRLKYRLYIAHQHMCKGLTEQEADAKWNEIFVIYLASELAQLRTLSWQWPCRDALRHSVARRWAVS